MDAIDEALFECACACARARAFVCVFVCVCMCPCVYPDCHVQDLLLEARHDACIAAASAALAKRDSSVPFVIHMQARLSCCVT